MDRNAPDSILARGPEVGGVGKGKAPLRSGAFCLVPGSSCRALNRGFALRFTILLPIEIDLVPDTGLSIPVPADGSRLLHNPGFVVIDVFEQGLLESQEYAHDSTKCYEFQPFRADVVIRLPQEEKDRQAEGPGGCTRQACQQPRYQAWRNAEYFVAELVDDRSV
jgi:hypothetical protein